MQLNGWRISSPECAHQHQYRQDDYYNTLVAAGRGKALRAPHAGDARDLQAPY